MKIVIGDIERFCYDQEGLSELIAKTKRPYTFIDKYGIDWLADLDDLPPNFLDVLNDEMFAVV